MDLNFKGIVIMGRCRTACAHCKANKGGCSPDCVYLPHFPPTEKGDMDWATVSTIYEGSYIKTIIAREATNRNGAVENLILEAHERVANPENGVIGELRDVKALLEERDQLLKEFLAKYHKHGAGKEGGGAGPSGASDNLPLVEGGGSGPSGALLLLARAADQLERGEPRADQLEEGERAGQLDRE